jgi:hypothetical protein
VLAQRPDLARAKGLLGPLGKSRATSNQSERGRPPDTERASLPERVNRMADTAMYTTPQASSFVGPHRPEHCHGPLGTTTKWLAFAHRGSFEGDAVRGLAETVQDGVGQGRVGHGGVPFLDRVLAGDQGGAQPGPVLDDLEQVPARLDGG